VVHGYRTGDRDAHGLRVTAAAAAGAGHAESWWIVRGDASSAVIV
jgi:hypothetical protein